MNLFNLIPWAKSLGYSRSTLQRALANSDFSQQDIRGVSWKQSNLCRANFSNTHAGLSLVLFLFQIVALSILSGLSGILAVSAAVWATGLWESEQIFQSLLPFLIAIVLVVFSLISVIKRGFLVLSGLSAISICLPGILFVFIQNSSLGGIFIYASFTALSELLSLWLGAVSIAGSLSLARLAIIITAFSALASVQLASEIVLKFSSSISPDWIDFSLAYFILLVGGIIGWNAFRADTRFPGIARLAIELTAIGGTSFWKANLAESDFSDSILKHTDFRNANLTRTRWYHSKCLEFARLGNTYLSNPKIRQLVVTCNGQGQNFDGLNLTGVNLQDARLQDASFIGASLNQSNLRGADLSRAILKQTQLEGADLTGATLTGAYIEDWGITSTTKLENVQCEYVYMRVPTKENPNPLRKPDNLRQSFAEGEFADFIQPFFDTLDLYHSQDVDPRAISIALRNLSAKHPDDDLQFVAIERRGNQGLNLRFTTTPRANKSELSHEYFASYAQIRKELPIAVQMQLAEQDTEIRTLKGTIEQFIQTGTHQSTIRAETIQVIQGELVVTENRDIKINAGNNANISGLVSGDGIVNLGTINGNVTHAINQLPDPSEPEQPNLKALLTQLQQIIQTDASLHDPDKSDLLEQVQALAEAKQTEEPAKREGITRKAMKIFDATLKSLPDTAKIVETCGKLLPLILKALGLPV